MEHKTDNIYIYLWEELNTIYIGRTINPKSRHYQHRHIPTENTYQFSNEHGVEHPKMIIIENNLTIEEGIEREKYWINHYRNSTNYSVLNKSCGGQYGRKKIYSKDEIKQHQKEYYQKNKDEIKQHQKEYYQKNKDKILEYSKNYSKNYKRKLTEKRKEYNKRYNKNYQKEHKEEILNKQKQYRKEHREEYLAQRKKHREKNREKILAYKRKYREKHREELRAKAREYQRKVRETKK